MEVLGVNKVGYVENINSEILGQTYNGSVIGMTDNSNVIGGPVSGEVSYGVFAFLPAQFPGVTFPFVFNITLFALFDNSLNFRRFFVRGSWGGEGVWKEISLT